VQPDASTAGSMQSTTLQRWQLAEEWAGEWKEKGENEPFRQSSALRSWNGHCDGDDYVHEGEESREHSWLGLFCGGKERVSRTCRRLCCVGPWDEECSREYRQLAAGFLYHIRTCLRISMFLQGMEVQMLWLKLSAEVLMQWRIAP
jgi:hypothetical protein